MKARRAGRRQEFKSLPLKIKSLLILGLLGLPIMLIGNLTNWSWYNTAAETWSLPPRDVLAPVFFLLFFLLIPVSPPDDPDRRPLDYLPWVARMLFAWMITTVAIYELAVWMGWLHSFS